MYIEKPIVEVETLKRDTTNVDSIVTDPEAALVK